ncbi:hypothetical protein D0T25_28850 [Duganella sp. BJB488]|uniref:hypothetical protein n=1 Tax=unclassified Duganella TaxID=2636909 RepID=UPI000E343737|nr:MULTISPECIES: hypothetical protein [unclassified Duganella]NVD73055.1 hypothetical protein [Duganella sp. BJB1802]RFP09795.1 hypothetical protein D0T26_29280 [Duganella sp. BJB489]RFP13345.1 hypothetical protein D0T25_28850 [Duganella sp. BJB488]RFP29360.1 hypothetical protein D0T24_29810 [Duganella sp. BJB480]
MKHLKLLPLLIAAAFAVPRAHAADQQPSTQQETSTHVAGLICIGLLMLGARGARSERFKALNEE